MNKDNALIVAEWRKAFGYSPSYRSSDKALVVADIDGTVADTYRQLCLDLGLDYATRTNYLGDNPDEFRLLRGWFDNPNLYSNAKPKQPVVNFLNRVALAGADIIFLTARPATIAVRTLMWLKQIGFERHKGVLFTRETFNDDSYVQAHIEKKATEHPALSRKIHLVKEFVATGVYKEIIVLEDDLAVVNAFTPKSDPKVNTILIDAPYNQDNAPHSIRVTGL